MLDMVENVTFLCKSKYLLSLLIFHMDISLVWQRKCIQNKR